MADDGLIGRQRERFAIEQALAAAQRGRGGVLLLAGEAGVGKTRLALDTLAGGDVRVFDASARPEGAQPYAPVTAVLRAYLRTANAEERPMERLREACGQLWPYLMLLLPELGTAAAGSGGDRATLFEALRLALVAIGHSRPTALFLDDLHWADDATLELLPALASALEREPLLVLGAYRSDDVPRGHGLRRARADLRRASRLREIVLEPLDREATAALLGRVLDTPAGPRLAAAIYDRTEGIPFFVEELAAALSSTGRLHVGAGGLELAPDESGSRAVDLPIPASVRDAILLGAEGLSPTGWSALELAAVAGLRFDLSLIAGLAGGEECLAEPLRRRLILEVEAGQGAFRHALVREALYGEIPWPRRRALHRQVAAALAAAGEPPGAIAEHWLEARETELARPNLLAAAEASCAVHAYRDAARLARRALELWPEGRQEDARLSVLERLGHCAELSGDLIEAGRVLREAADGHRQAGSLLAFARAEQRLASIYELQASWERAAAARLAAADAFAASGQPSDAAAERLTVAGHLDGVDQMGTALEILATASAEIEQAGSNELRARALAIEGMALVRLGSAEAGLAKVRAGLGLALETNLPAAAADAYYTLASALEYAADHAGARDTFRAASEFCQARGMPPMATVCLACLAVILHQLGDWDRAIAICAEVRDSVEAPPAGRAVAADVMGAIYAWRGDAKRARRLLLEAVAHARRSGIAALELDATWGLAVADELSGRHADAVDQCRTLLRRWQETDERHYVIHPLRWAATFLASHGAAAEVRACADALARIAAGPGYPDSLSALAHALGECALLEGDAALAVEHFNQSLARLREADAPLERAETQVRMGAALARLGQRESAVERLVDAHRLARRLGARPLAGRIVAELAALGESIEHRLGRRASGQLARGGLSRRELEVLRLVAVGRSNREIAGELFLTTRTVDMHVHNLLAKLSCRSRAEAAYRATELGLLAAAGPIRA